MQIKIDNNEFREGVLSCLASQVDELIERNIPSLKAKLREQLKTCFMEDRLWAELCQPGSYSRALLGLTPDIDVEHLIDIFARQVNIDYSPAQRFGGTIRAKMTVEILEQDYTKVLAQPSAVSTHPQSGKTFNWLEALLDPFTIQGFHVWPANRFEVSRFSRSRDLIMLKGGQFNFPDYFIDSLDRVLDSFIPHLTENIYDMVL
jgi:hypothetical protein